MGTKTAYSSVHGIERGLIDVRFAWSLPASWRGGSYIK